MEVGYSSARSPGQEFDVYFSFSNKDESRYIADFGGKALAMKGIRTFADETQGKLDRERRVLIQASRVALVVLSEEYFKSNFCLEELTVILQCREDLGLMVVPVFSKVNPSDLRKCRGSAAIALNRQKIGGYWWRRWKNSLHQASDLCGWDSDRHFERSHSKFVGLIVDDIVHKRFPSNLKISINPIGYDACYEYLNLFLQMGSNEAVIVGIGGQSQMGKTMMAKAIYDGIVHAFEGASFLRDVGHKAKRPNGLVFLQQKLICDVLLGEEIDYISDLISGVNEIKKRLSSKKILIVLDDVSDLDQLYALVGSRKWFGKGSKIIITTRILELLQIFGVDQIFMAQGLPLPLDIIEIWEPYQQSCSQIAGLKEYIQSLHYLTNEKAKYLEDCLRRETMKSEIQAQKIVELKHGKKEEMSSSSSSTN